MSAPGPLLFVWEGDLMRPLGRFAAECDRRFVIGERYPLILQETRSAASHAHYFACINDAWGNLPEAYADRLPTAEHLRKFALIKAGYRDERTLLARTKAEALRLAAFIRPMDDFAVVQVEGKQVIAWTAKSQSLAAMGKVAFQDSKQKVLDIIAEIIGVQPAALESNVRRAA